MAKESLLGMVDLPRLKTSIDQDFLALQIYREKLTAHVREFCGDNYSDNGTVESKPFNLLSLFVRVVSDYLIGADPRMMVSTFTTEVRPYASAMQSWGNKQLIRMKFADIMRLAVVDAQFLMAVVRIALTAPAEARFGYGKAVGQVSMDNILFEDMIFDSRAKKFHQCDYIGHYYDVWFDDLKSSTLFDKTARLKVVPRDDTGLTKTGDERIGELGAGRPTTTEYYKKARLCEVWLRKENLVVTFDANGDFEKPLMVQKWVGPDCGPYHFLSFSQVPGNLMPKSPIMDLVNVDRSFNLLHRKLDNQASRQRTNPIYRDADFAARWKDAKDGQPIQAESPQAIAELKTGGPTQEIASWAMMQYNLFSEYAGNLKSLGGLASQSDTATQEKLVHQSASNLVEAMGGRVQAFAQQLMINLGWFNWHSPRQDFKTSYSPPGMPDVSIDRTVTPQKRFGIPYEEIDIQIDPYSLVRQTPQMRVRAMDDMMAFVLKALPMFGQQGVRELVSAYFRKKGRYTNNPDLEELWEILQGVDGPPANPESQPGAPQQQGMPDETTRNYVRTSQPGMTDQGHMQALQQLMAGGQPAPGAPAGGLGQMGRAG